ncbi:hypothetical protein OIU78_022555, partial [Salix suchowensis]
MVAGLPWWLYGGEGLPSGRRREAVGAEELATDGWGPRERVVEVLEADGAAKWGLLWCTELLRWPICEGVEELPELRAAVMSVLWVKRGEAVGAEKLATDGWRGGLTGREGCRRE